MKFLLNFPKKCLEKSAFKILSRRQFSGDSVAKMLPSSARVVICGGGATGCSVFYHLTSKGWTDVVLLEQGRIACGTSWHAAGLIGCMRDSNALINMAVYGRNLYKWMEETGHHTGFKQCGSINIAASEDRLIYLRRLADKCRALNVEVAELKKEDVEIYSKWVNLDDVKGCFYLPEDGVASPTDLCNAFVKMGTEKGGKVFENCQIKNVQTSNGKVSAIETSLGKIDCEHFVLCAGMWAKDFGSKCKPPVNIPLQATEHFYLITRTLKGVDRMHPVVRDHDARTYAREWNGGFLVGVFEKESLPVFEDGIPEKFEFQLLPNNWSYFQQYYDPIMERFPILHNVEVHQMTNGAESFTADGEPLIGEVAEIKNFYVCTGMNSSGIALAAGFGKALSQIIMKGQTSFDLSAFDVKRCFEHQSNQSFLSTRVKEVLGAHYALHYPKQSFPCNGRPFQTSSLYSLLQNKGCYFGTENDFEMPLVFSKTDSEKRKDSFGKPWFYDDVQKEYNFGKEKMAVSDMTSRYNLFKLTVSNQIPDLLQPFCDLLAVDKDETIKTKIFDEKGCYLLECVFTKESNNEFLMLCPRSSTSYFQYWLHKNRATDQGISVENMSESVTFLGFLGKEVPSYIKNLTGVRLEKDRSKKMKIGHCDSVIAYHHHDLPYEGLLLAVPAKFSQEVYDTLIENSADIGRHALEALRIEAGLLWWGHDITPGMRKVQTSRIMTPDLEDAIRPIKFTVPDCHSESPVWLWGGEPIYSGRLFKIGSVTSIAYSYQRQTFVGIALLDNGSGNGDEELFVINAGQRCPIRVFK